MGMNINAQNYFGNSNLYALISSGREEDEKLKYLKQILEIYRANVFLLNQNGENIFHLTATIGHRNIGSYLINVRNMNVNQQDSFGNSPLMYALFQNNTAEKKTEMEILNFVKDLIEIHGANPRLKNLQELSPLSLSFDQNYHKISAYLEQQCDKMHRKDDSLNLSNNRSHRKNDSLNLSTNRSKKMLDTLVQSLDHLLYTGNTILESMNLTLQENNVALLQENEIKIDDL